MTTTDLTGRRSDDTPAPHPGLEIARLIGRDVGALAFVTVLAGGLVAVVVGSVVLAVDRVLPALVGLFG